MSASCCNIACRDYAMFIVFCKKICYTLNRTTLEEDSMYDKETQRRNEPGLLYQLGFSAALVVCVIAVMYGLMH